MLDISGGQSFSQDRDELLGVPFIYMHVELHLRSGAYTLAAQNKLREETAQKPSRNLGAFERFDQEVLDAS